MKIDRAILEEQIEVFERQRAEFQTGVDMAAGGIQACQHMIKLLQMKKPREEKTRELKDLFPDGAKITETDAQGKPKQ